MIKHWLSWFEFHHALLETVATHLLQDSPLNGLGPLEEHVEYTASELAPYVLKDLSYLLLGTDHIEVILSHSETGKLLREQ